MGKINFKGILGVLALGFVLAFGVSCTKKQVLDNRVKKDPYLDKALFGEFTSGVESAAIKGKQFHLVRGVEEASSKNDVGAVPGVLQDYGIVETKITETELQFLEVYPANPQREEVKIVIASFPIDKHFDIQRGDNDYGELTNDIVEDTEDRPWYRRRYMRVDWESPNKDNFKLSGNLWSWGSKTVQNSLMLENFKVDKDGHMSFLVEENIKNTIQWNFFSYYMGLLFGSDPNSGFTVRYRTHIMPVKASDYTPLAYDDKEFERFGFFRTRRTSKTYGKGVLDDDVQYMANRHNVCEPGRTLSNGAAASCSSNQIVWHLNKEFDDKYLEATRKVVNMWNDAFKDALGRQDDVVVLEESERVNMSDPRFNVLVLYAPENSAGPLGLGQTVTDPRTGEIIAARAIMYTDGLQWTIGYMDDILDQLERDPEFVNSFATPAVNIQSITQGASPLTHGVQHFARTMAAGESSKVVSPAQQFVPQKWINALKGNQLIDTRSKMPNLLKMKRGKLDGTYAVDSFAKSPQAAVAKHRKAIEAAPEVFDFGLSQLQSPVLKGMAYEAEVLQGKTFDPDMKMALQAMEPYLNPGEALRPFQGQGFSGRRDLSGWNEEASKQGINFEPVEFAARAVENYVRKIIRANEGKPFSEIRKLVKQDIEENIYIMLTAHEMGHALGLRHNFNGSSDKNNFHPQFHDLYARMKNGDQSVKMEDLEEYAFSSVMDYGDFFYFQGIGGLGSYDKAAIKYGYFGFPCDEELRGDAEACASNSRAKRMADPIVQANFQFCTDQRVGEDITCRRFDRGWNATTITLAEIENYQAGYLRSHFRRDRASFDFNMGGAAGRSMMRFMNIRQVFDEMIYNLIPGDDFDITQLSAGTCAFAFQQDSIENGEIGNVCDPNTAGEWGLPTWEIENWSRALIDPKSNRPYKDFRDYEANKLADLVLANQIAMNFFQSVIAAPEPGHYLYQEVQVAPNQVIPIVAPLPSLSRDSQGSGYEVKTAAEVSAEGETLLRTLATLQNMDANQIDQFVAENKKNLIYFQRGMNSKYLSYFEKYEGEMYKLQRVGYGIDKYLAINALAVRDVGVSKYRQRGFQANAYLLPQSRDLVMNLANSLIAENPWISQANLRKGDGTTAENVLIPAAYPSNMDLMMIITGLANFASENERSIVSQMKICIDGETGCGGTGVKSDSVEFLSADGLSNFKVIRTVEGESIAFNMVRQAAQLSNQRSQLIEMRDNAQPMVEQSRVEAEPGRQKLHDLFMQVPELNEFATSITDNSEGAESIWNLVGLLNQAYPQMPDQQFQQVIQFMNQKVGAAAEKINDLAQAHGLAEGQNIQQDTTVKSALGGQGDQPGQPGQKPAQTDEPVQGADSAQKALIQEVIVAFNEHMQFLGNTVNLIVGVKTGQIQTQINDMTDDLEYEESNIYFIRRFMRLLEHE